MHIFLKMRFSAYTSAGMDLLTHLEHVHTELIQQGQEANHHPGPQLRSNLGRGGVVRQQVVLPELLGLIVKQRKPTKQHPPTHPPTQHPTHIQTYTWASTKNTPPHRFTRTSSERIRRRKKSTNQREDPERGWEGRDERRGEGGRGTRSGGEGRGGKGGGGRGEEGGGEGGEGGQARVE